MLQCGDVDTHPQLLLLHLDPLESFSLSLKKVFSAKFVFIFVFYCRSEMVFQRACQDVTVGLEGVLDEDPELAQEKILSRKHIFSFSGCADEVAPLGQLLVEACAVGGPVCALLFAKVGILSSSCHSGNTYVCVGFFSNECCWNVVSLHAECHFCVAGGCYAVLQPAPLCCSVLAVCHDEFGGCSGGRSCAAHDFLERMSRVVAQSHLKVVPPFCGVGSEFPDA